MKQVTSSTPRCVGRSRAAPAPAPAPRRGFTVPEVLITMAVLAIIMSIAIPSYFNGIRKSRRAEAMTALNDVLQKQERHRSSNPSFTSDLTGALPAGLGLPSTTTEKGYYTLSLSSVTGTGYIASASAVSGTSQYSDGNCSVLSVRISGGNVQYGAGATINWADPDRCWAR